MRNERTLDSVNFLKLWRADPGSTRARVQSPVRLGLCAPSRKHSRSDLRKRLARVPTAAREGACAPQRNTDRARSYEDSKFCPAMIPNPSRKIPLAGRDFLTPRLMVTAKSSNEKCLQLPLVFGTAVAYGSGEHCRSLVQLCTQDSPLFLSPPP